MEVKTLEQMEKRVSQLKNKIWNEALRISYAQEQLSYYIEECESLKESGADIDYLEEYVDKWYMLSDKLFEVCSFLLTEGKGFTLDPQTEKLREVEKVYLDNLNK